jgi:hypothetical protein
MTLMRARPQCHAKLWEPIGRMRRQRHRQAASLHGLKSPYFGFGTKRNSSRQRISSTIRTSPRSSSALRANCGPSLSAARTAASRSGGKSLAIFSTSAASWFLAPVTSGTRSARRFGKALTAFAVRMICLCVPLAPMARAIRTETAWLRVVTWSTVRRAAVRPSTLSAAANRAPPPPSPF